LRRAAAAEEGVEALNAILAVDQHGARDAAARIDKLDSAARAAMPLAGVPVVVKDNIATLRMATSCGSRILQDYVSPYEATAVTRLQSAGAIVLGKSNM